MSAPAAAASGGKFKKFVGTLFRVAVTIGAVLFVVWFAHDVVGIEQRHLAVTFREWSKCVDGWENVWDAMWTFEARRVSHAIWTNFKVMTWNFVGPIVIGGLIAFAIHPVAAFIWVLVLGIIYLLGVLGPFALVLFVALFAMIGAVKLVKALWGAGG